MERLSGEKSVDIKLRVLRVNDVTQGYVNWFKDEEVVKFSNNQHRKFTLEGQQEYVVSCLKDGNTELYGIFDNDFHIGNIVISGLKSKQNRAEIGFVIGEKSYWNKGIMTYMISQVIVLSKNIYNLNELFSYSIPANVGGIKVLEKNNFIQDGILKDHVLLNNKYEDEICYSLVLPKDNT